MGMNPESELFEPLALEADAAKAWAAGWPVFTIGEGIEIEDGRYRVLDCFDKTLVLACERLGNNAAAAGEIHEIRGWRFAVRSWDSGTLILRGAGKPDGYEKLKQKLRLDFRIRDDDFRRASCGRTHPER